ncbi:F-box only protein 7-like isoform X1 [Limulus polyphemus]|uniref:F-box only protein 7-like isoform X1 n=1 Tax=Limulus polyphemus TaxID=6850 RepID=A0ABM1BHB4_LIMPO|nr:F-box only protein 7-like isoform X1 [Limulus polyphemus]XP_013781999.1 F-box only protein 7-like isoform X1 [Limulus polyphemus]XP_013782000.1 F-box only protein 7-like isoform X1 [Limulus polyphemus]XP_013782001.1 F-box only protein 7-like isoform X1 [Limulus polyphemus]XP_013782002.1 F-box only protein 7-like isoform X1 [Limulus polyphemus]XP_022249966.1 F-box only protein 7-like isoform X1 [Limulus polyphemus]
MNVRFPKQLQNFFNEGAIQDGHEALSIAFHSFMLETGFQPRDTKSSEELPNSWRKAGSYCVTYSHPTCPEVTCTLTCVPIGSFLISYLFTEKSLDSPIQLKMKVQKYIEEDFKNSDSSKDIDKVYKNLTHLSKIFKDSVAYKILASLQSAMGICPTFGFPCLPYDIKVLILMYLPVRDIIRMSATNKEFHIITQDILLWRYLFFRDFPTEAQKYEKKSPDWKNLYQKEYKRKQELLSLQSRSVIVVPNFPFQSNDHEGIPRVMWPPGILGGEFDRHPNLPGLPPQPSFRDFGPRIPSNFRGPAPPPFHFL